MKKLLFLALFGTGFAQLQAQTIPKGEPVSVADLAKANNAFAANFYKQLFKTEAPETNIFYSPYSVSSAFSLLFSGTAQQSEQEIAKVFGWDKNTQAHAASCAQLAKQMTSQKSEKGVTFQPVNRIFLNQKGKILPDYANLMQKVYESEIEKVDFNDNVAAADRINTWVEDQTNKKIKNLVPASALDPLAAMVLVNAVYFLGDWEVGFNPKNTEKEPFYTQAKKQEKVDFMKGEFVENDASAFGYKKTETYEVLEMPYKGKKMSMVVVLPSEKIGLKGLVADLTPNKMSDWFKKLENDYEIANIQIPKWKHEFSKSLKEDLIDVGLKTIFDELNFSRALLGEFVVSDVFHKAFVEVSEKGTEAAAATAIVVKMTESVEVRLPKQFNFVANRPFVYLIRDNESGTVLFMGQYAQP
jgi:serine protease inhibitor